MSTFFRLSKSILASPRFILILVCVTIITRFGTVIAPKTTDDYMQQIALVGNKTLYEKGFMSANPDLPFFSQIDNVFNFFDADQGNLSGLVNYGALPWWTDPEAKIHLYRPLSAITHWIDYQFWPDNVVWMHLESLTIFTFLVLTVYQLYRENSGIKYSDIQDGETSGLQCVAALAALFYCLDVSHNSSISWLASRNALLATLFGVMSITHFIRWRENAKQFNLLISLVLLLTSLFSAEAGIATVGYLFGYMLWVDRAPLWHRAVALIPFVMLILAWRFSYNYAGFGSTNVAHYVDPGRDPIRFIGQYIKSFPLMFASVNTGADNLISLFSIEFQQQIWVFAVLISALFLLVLWPVVRCNSHCRFWLTGSLIACIPPCALNEITARIFGFISLGFFIVVAHFVRWSLSAKQKTNNIISANFASRAWLKLRTISFRAFAYLGLIAHLVIPALVLTIGSFVYAEKYLAGDVNQFASERYYDIEDFSYENRVVVFLNAPFTFVLQFIPYQLMSEGKPIPEALRVLAPGHSEILITRVNDNSLEVEARGGFSVVDDTDIPVENLRVTASNAHKSRSLMGFFRTHDHNFFTGQKFELPGNTIEILQTLDGLPEKIRVVFNNSLDDERYLYLLWSWTEKRFSNVKIPRPGETIRTEAPGLGT